MSEIWKQVLELLRKAPPIAERVLGQNGLTPEFLQELKRTGAVDEITRLKLAALAQTRPEMRNLAMQKLLGQATTEGLLPTELFHGTGSDAIKGIAEKGAMVPQVSWQDTNTHLSAQASRSYWATDPKVAIGMALESSKTGSMREELRHQALSAAKNKSKVEQLKDLGSGFATWVQPKVNKHPLEASSSAYARTLTSKYAQKLASQWKLEPSHPSVVYYALDAAEAKLGDVLTKLRSTNRPHKELDRAYRQVSQAREYLQEKVNGLLGLAKNADPSAYWGDNNITGLWNMTKQPIQPPAPKVDPAIIRARLKALLPHMDEESKSQLRDLLKERLSIDPQYMEAHGPVPVSRIYELRTKGEIPAKMLKAEVTPAGQWVTPKSRKQAEPLMALARKLLRKGR